MTVTEPGLFFMRVVQRFASYVYIVLTSTVVLTVPKYLYPSYTVHLGLNYLFKIHMLLNCMSVVTCNITNKYNKIQRLKARSFKYHSGNRHAQISRSALR